MSFVDDLEDSALDIAEFTGAEAVLTRVVGGDPVDCYVSVSKGAEMLPEGFSAVVSSSRVTIQFCLVEIETAAAKGDSVVISDGLFAGTYTVQAEEENDGYFQRVIVK